MLIHGRKSDQRVRSAEQESAPTGWAVHSSSVRWPTAGRSRGILDGPLAFDNAIDSEAVRIKGICSEVAGRAQILVVPDLEAGNMLAKNLTFLARGDAVGIVLGARLPIVLTSRADSVRTRMASCAVAVLYAHALREPSSSSMPDPLPSGTADQLQGADVHGSDLLWLVGVTALHRD
jgi:phosphate acetyl/butyryl transferase